MKKFSSLKEEVKPKYELKDSLKNEIYSLIENSLSIKMSDEKLLSEDINIYGKDKLVEDIKKLIDDVRVKERTLTLETVKANVHRNFDMRWLTSQIEDLNKIKIGSNFILKENIKDANFDDQFKGQLINYFVKKLNESKRIGEFEFNYDPSVGIFEFVNDIDNIVVKATPFYNDNSGIPIEVFDDEEVENHIFIEQRNFSVEDILFNKYLEIMEKFLVQDYDVWVDKVNKYDENV
jgi:hypothetical protein